MQRSIIAIICTVSVIFISGCVQRQITINTEPQGALVELNDEQIGISPVTVDFQWYGDFDIRLSKDGYQTLATHKKLERPLRDKFPLDLFDDIFSTRVDAYKWDFTLQQYSNPTRQELIEAAEQIKKQAAN